MVLDFLAAALLGFSTLWQAPAGRLPPTTTGTTPAACLQEVRDYTQKRQQEVPAVPAPGQPMSPEAVQASRQRGAVLQQINQAGTAMAKECASKFDAKTVAAGELPAFIDLAALAALPDAQSAAVARALSLTTLSPEQRASVLVQAVTVGIREQRSQKIDERMTRLETLVDELDKSSGATLDQKIGTHAALLSWYRYDDVDGGIIKHSTWMIDTGKTLTADQRKRWGNAVVIAYIDMAEAWAGQGMNDQALDLLRRAPKEWPDALGYSNIVNSALARFSLVGTPGAALTAPRWLNLPATAKELAMPGSVTLLEFSAHWCIPCKESYPGVNRLRAKYGPQGFRVVLATQLYGYFEKEGIPDRNLPADVEIARDRTYFAEHGMDVPIAIADRTDQNMTNYRVGGIPQIMLVDKKGTIRLIMVGYDDANEPKLAKIIEGLLAEK